MEQKIISFASMTNAMKARDALRKKGIQSKLVRTPARLRQGSCGYSLIIPRKADAAVELLNRYNIPYKGVFADGSS